MNLNDRQRKLVMVGVILFILMGVFPPWMYTFDAQTVHSEKPAGYALIFSPPLTEYPENVRFGVKIDSTRLVVQWLILAAATSCCVFMSGGKGIAQDTDETATKRFSSYVPTFDMLRGDNKKKVLFWAIAAICFAAGLAVNPTETAKWFFIALILQVIRIYGGRKIF
ncbi:MAG: hypothetical protein HIU83_15770 [Proteobacteria bacterium]|nr:hypothetical protein [Pseudomonadota bacterium]